MSTDANTSLPCPMMAAGSLDLAAARRTRLIAIARRHAWWLGWRTSLIRKILALSGWRLSRLGYRLLGRPRGALAWPLGLSFLVLNAEAATVRADISWVRRCYAGLIDAKGRSRIEKLAIDQGGLGYGALRLYQLLGDERYLRYALSLGDAFLALPGAASGCISYTVGRRDVLVDTVGFICPFLARLTRQTGNPAYAATAVAQLDAMWRHGHADGGWVHHAFDAKDFKTQGLAGWGRGVGWLLLGIVDTAIELPEGEDRKLWIERGAALLARLNGCQRADGHWPWRLDAPEETTDSSVTALVAYSLARWHQAGWARADFFRDMASRCRAAIDAVTDADGCVGQSSGEAGGVGLYSTRFGCFLWTQAAAVAADRILASPSPDFAPGAATAEGTAPARNTPAVY